MNPNMEHLANCHKGKVNLCQEDALILYIKVWSKQLIPNKEAIGVQILNTDYREQSYDTAPRANAQTNSEIREEKNG